MPEGILAKIMAEMVVEKEKRLAEIWEKAKKEKMKEINLSEMYKQETVEVPLKTGTLLDSIIGGGLPSGKSMLIYGGFGSGKTQTCFTMCVECPDHIVYIDTEGSFRATRLKQICDARDKSFEEVIKKVHLYQPIEWIEQCMILPNLPSPADIDGKIGLVILDSISKRFRGIEFAGRQTLQNKQPLVRESTFDLERYVREVGAALIITTQIYESPSGNPFMPAWANERPVGGSSLEHQPDFVVHLRRAAGNVRIARLVDSSFTPLMERPFQITAKGIEDLPEAARKMVEQTEKFEKEQLQPWLKERKKKKGKEEDKDKEGDEEEPKEEEKEEQT